MCQGPMKGMGWLAFLPSQVGSKLGQPVPAQPQGVSGEDQRQRQGPTRGHTFLAQRAAE